MKCSPIGNDLPLTHRSNQIEIGRIWSFICVCILIHIIIIIQTWTLKIMGKSLLNRLVCMITIVIISHHFILIHSLPTANLTINSESVLHRYRTNFLDVLRFKSRLVRSSTRNVQTLLNASSNGTTSTLQTSSPSTDTIEIDESIDSNPFPFNRQCGIPTRAEIMRRGRIVGGETVHDGEYPWMVRLIPV